MVTVEAIPFRNFRERIKLIKELTKKNKPDIIEVHETFIYIQRGKQDDRGLQAIIKQH
jgi:uncharacterized membrane-anchored protein